MPTSFRNSRRLACAAVLLMIAGACSDDDAENASTTAHPTTTSTTAAVTTTTSPTTTTATTTTTAPTTTTTSTTLPPTTTTTTLPPPPAVEWGEFQALIGYPPHFVAGPGQVGTARLNRVIGVPDGLLAVGRESVFGQFVNVGPFETRDSYDSALAFGSADGAEWERRADLPRPGFFDEYVIDATPFDGGFVAAGRWRTSGSTPTQVDGTWTFPTDDYDAAVWISIDGRTWTFVDDGDLGGDANEEINAVVPGGPGLVAVGNATVIPDFGDPTARFVADGAVWVSEDGTEWTRLDDLGGVFSGGPSRSLTAALTADGALYAIGSEESAFGRDSLGVWRSEDGLSWEQVTDVPPATSTLHVTGAVWSEDGFVVVGNSQDADGTIPVAFWSGDGSSWEAVTLDLGLPGRLEAVTATPFGYVAVGADYTADLAQGLILVSGDGLHWHRDQPAAFETFDREEMLLWQIDSFGDTVIVSGYFEYADETQALVIWAGVAGPGTAPVTEVTEDGGATEVNADELLAYIEERVVIALDAEATAADSCPAAAEILVNTDPDNPILGDEDAAIVVECSDALAWADLAAVEAETAADRLDLSAPGSEEAVAAAGLAADARAAADRAQQAMQAAMLAAASG